MYILYAPDKNLSLYSIFVIAVLNSSNFFLNCFSYVHISVWTLIFFCVIFVYYSMIQRQSSMKNFEKDPNIQEKLQANLPQAGGITGCIWNLHYNGCNLSAMVCSRMVVPKLSIVKAGSFEDGWIMGLWLIMGALGSWGLVGKWGLITRSVSWGPGVELTKTETSKMWTKMTLSSFKLLVLYSLYQWKESG